ncbi:hypothetical protein CS0771_34120 [Catellatospora sp. IY07-71]|uniref:hypothetical protein n=1 Tax=Catellatospora sp. IY07-71 TaxID=2728827 RepID=UPI001BB2FE35|nr:hypothetical protein [Catellatospora sp. IY07-71]BCJ73868.1 hypothetical protein CS0771_34120 [Catellatospora sp. IY07-71]
MPVGHSTPLAWAGRTAALCLPLALGLVVTSTAYGRPAHRPKPHPTASPSASPTPAPQPSPTATGTPAPTASATSTPGPVPTAPGVPDTLRLSSYPYDGFQFCAGGHPVSTSLTPTLAASPTEPDGSYPGPAQPYPDLVGRFEIALPDGAAFLSVLAPHSSDYVLAYGVPPGVLTDGEYRWRVRAEDGAEVSAWAPWCSFTVRTTA